MTISYLTSNLFMPEEHGPKEDILVFFSRAARKIQFPSETKFLQPLQILTILSSGSAT